MRAVAMALGVLTTVCLFADGGKSQGDVPRARHGAYPSFHAPGTGVGEEPGTAAWSRFLEHEGAGWHFVRNTTTGTAHRILGRRGPAPDGVEPGESLEPLARRILEREAELLGIDPTTPVLRSHRRVGRLWSFLYEDRREDLPLRGSRIEVRLFEDGSLVLLGADTLSAQAERPRPPILDVTEAVFVARRLLNDDTSFEEVREVVYGIPSPDGPVAARGFEIFLGSAQLFINGLDGQLDYARSLEHQVQVVGDAVGFGTPGLEPDTGANPPVETPLPFLNVLVEGFLAGATDADGNFDFDLPGVGPVEVTASLDGPFVDVVSNTGPDISFTGTFQDGVAGQIVFNVSPTELATAQVNGFLAVNEAHSFITTADDTFVDMDFPLTTNVNVAGTCNAFYNGAQNALNFLVAGPPCPNTAYSSIVYHEYDHAVVNAVYGLGNYPDGNLNEGLADALAALVSDDPRIGIDFLGPGTLIRDVDTPDRVFPDAIGTGQWEEGLIVAGAFWDTRTELVASLGPVDGRQTAGFLHIATLQLQPQDISPDITIDVLMVDDDDGDISNGTPHYDEIATGFGLHGLDAPPIMGGGGDEFIRGDANGDGAVGGLPDGLFLLNFQFVMGSPGPPCEKAADFDDSGTVQGLVDGLGVLNFQFVAGSPPPAIPYPDCGEDPTMDALGCESPPCP